MSVILLFGPPGSGKTTLGLQLAEKYPDEFISVDIDKALDDLPLNIYRPDYIDMIKPALKRAEESKKIVVVSHIPIPTTAIERLARVLVFYVFTPLTLNITREIRRDAPHVIPISVLRHYSSIYTANSDLAEGPVLEVLTHKIVEDALKSAKVVFNDEIELYNLIGTFFGWLNVRHDTKKLQVRVRRTRTPANLLVASSVDDRISTLLKFVKINWP